MYSEEHPITEHPQISICFNDPTTSDPIDAWKVYELGSDINITYIYGSKGSELILGENENKLPESQNEFIVVKRSTRCYTLTAMSNSKEFHPLNGQHRQIKLEFSPKIKAMDNDLSKSILSIDFYELTNYVLFRKNNIAKYDLLHGHFSGKCTRF